MQKQCGQELSFEMDASASSAQRNEDNLFTDDVLIAEETIDGNTNTGEHTYSGENSDAEHQDLSDNDRDNDLVDINDGEEVWSGSDDDIENLDSQAFDGDVGSGMSREVKLITCLLHFILLFQAKFYISDAAIIYLLKFMHMFLCLLNILNVVDGFKFPLTIHSLVKFLKHSSHSLDYGSVDQLLPLLDDGLLVGQVATKGSTRRRVSVLSSWVEAWNILHSDCAQTALELVKYSSASSSHPMAAALSSKQAHYHTSRHYSTIWCTRVLGPRLWWRALFQGLAMCCTSGLVISMNSHHFMPSELTPLYEQQAHTTLQPASLHHSTTSELTSSYEHELTPLYDQRAHTTLQPASSHHSTTSKLTPLYNHELTSLYNHSTTSELTPLYDHMRACSRTPYGAGKKKLEVSIRGIKKLSKLSKRYAE
eukprot:Em0006g1538a